MLFKILFSLSYIIFFLIKCQQSLLPSLRFWGRPITIDNDWWTELVFCRDGWQFNFPLRNRKRKMLDYWSSHKRQKVEVGGSESCWDKFKVASEECLENQRWKWFCISWSWVLIFLDNGSGEDVTEFTATAHESFELSQLKQTSTTPFGLPGINPNLRFMHSLFPWSSIPDHISNITLQHSSTLSCNNQEI